MKTISSIIKRVKKRLRAPYHYFLLRLKALQASVNDWKKSKSRKGVIPVPPPLLRYRVGGSLQLGDYLEIGERCANDIRNVIESIHKNIYSFNSILDFGCGSGRVLRHFHDVSERCKLYGTDIDAEAIQWCDKNLKFGSWGVNDFLPPTKYRDDFFDLIYAISVFTHLDENMQFQWLRELKRISKPGGILILTVHGTTTQSHLSKTKKALIAEKGFFFDVGETGRFKRNGLPDFYQDTYHTREYVENKWSEFFTILGWREAAINSAQDAVILQNW